MQLKHTLPFTLILLLTFSVTFAQEVRITDRSNQSFSKLKSSQTIYTLNAQIDTTLLTYVGAAEIVSPAQVAIEKVYDKLKSEAKNLGANGFRLLSLNEDYSVCRIQFYKLDEAAIDSNKALSSAHTLYVFSGEKFDTSEYYTFECNGVSRSVKNGTFFMYTLKEGEKIKLRKGTVTGTTMWVQWKPNGGQTFLTIHGFYKEPVVKRTTQSPSVKPGKFNPVDGEFGRFLIQVLDPSAQ